MTHGQQCDVPECDGSAVYLLSTECWVCEECWEWLADQDEPTPDPWHYTSTNERMRMQRESECGERARESRQLNMISRTERRRGGAK